MTINQKKLLFFSLYFLSFAFVPLVVLGNTPFSTITKNSIILVNSLQRVFGLLAFMALFYQIILGAYLTKITEKLGSWVFDLHIIQGLIIYAGIVVHPALFLVFNYFAGRGLDPIYVFLQICLICKNNTEVYYTFGRVAFWLINLTVFAGFFRTLNPFLRLHWRKFHILNYFVFALVSIHAYYLGSDFIRQPFLSFVIISNLIILYIFVFKKLPKFIGEFKKWYQKD